jgi:hypothetical protein
MIRVVLTNPSMVIRSGWATSAPDDDCERSQAFTAHRVRLNGERIDLGDGAEWTEAIDILTSGGEARYAVSAPAPEGGIRRIVYQTITIDAAD